MTSVGSNYCVDAHMELTPHPINMRPPEPDHPPCGRHKWMVSYYVM